MPPAGVEIEDAVAQLKFDTAADLEPVVTDEQLETILVRCQLADADDLAPSDEDWVGTYDFNLAQALVYERKATMIAQQVTFSSDGSKFDLNARVERYRDMAKGARDRRFAQYGSGLDGNSDDEEDEDDL